MPQEEKEQDIKHDKFYQEKIKALEQLIFTGKATYDIKCFDRIWTFKVLDKEEHAKVYSIATSEDSDASGWQRFKIEVISRALVAINHVEISEELREKYVCQFPQAILDKLFEKYNEINNYDMTEVSDNMDLIENYVKDIKNNFYAHIRFTVMKEFKVLPTEKRAQEMNDYQWLYLYYGIMQDRKNKSELKQQEVEYLTFFINPELAKNVYQDKNNNKKGTKKYSNVYVTKEHDEADPNNPNSVIHYKETTVDEDFDKKLAMYMKDDEPLTELSDATHKGDPNESKEDFLARAFAGQELAKKQEQEYMQRKKAEELKQQQETNKELEDTDMIFVPDDNK